MRLRGGLDMSVKENNKTDTFGNTFFGVFIAISIMVVLFNGDPDIADALRVIMLNAAGLN